MNVAIVLSGGAGTRLGSDIPKQYIRISGKMLITYCLETLIRHPLIDGVQIVADHQWQENILTDAREEGLNLHKVLGFSTPGQERQSSIWNALRDIAADEDRAVDTVLIHDAARPNLSAEMITQCMTALEGHDGVMPVLPMKDTVYLSKDGKGVSELLDRSRIFAGQAPELFLYEKYMQANEALLPDRIKQIKGSSEPAIMAGMDIVMIPGDESNYKITTQTDLERFKNSMEKSGAE